MLHLMTLLSTAAVLLFADGTSQPAKAPAAQPAAQAPQPAVKQQTAQQSAAKQPAAQKPAAQQQTVRPMAPLTNQSVSMTTKTAKPDVKKLNDLNTVEQAIISDTNAERAKYGLPALAVDTSLEQAARSHTAWMTNYHSMTHTNAPVAENIGMGQRSAEEIVAQWMASSGHRANILNGGYRRIGAAAYTATDGSIFWCEEFLP